MRATLPCRDAADAFAGAGALSAEMRHVMMMFSCLPPAYAAPRFVDEPLFDIEVRA